MSEVRENRVVALSNIRPRVLTGFFERMRGLLGRDGLPEGEVYVFPRCGSVHTFGMRFAIDVAFLDKGGRVLAVHENVRPGRMVFGGFRAATTVEAQTGWLAKSLSPGDLFPASFRLRSER